LNKKPHLNVIEMPDSDKKESRDAKREILEKILENEDIKEVVAVIGLDENKQPSFVMQGLTLTGKLIIKHTFEKTLDQLIDMDLGMVVREN